MLDQFWYKKNGLARLLSPLACGFRAAAAVRKTFYQHCHLKYFPVPVIVVGNIMVGGTGKTPLVIWLIDFLRQQGFKPAIVSRGYGGKAAHYPYRVTEDTDPAIAGDEAVLLARRTQCPVMIAPKRNEAVLALLEATDTDIIISDDGLQHYAMPRQMEIVVVDEARGLGNGLCLPAGPLREPAARLKSVDFVVTHGRQGQYSMQLMPGQITAVRDARTQIDMEYFSGKKLHAVAAIGYPQRFFQSLRDMGLAIIEHSFPDHHRFQPSDFSAMRQAPIIMTEKDQVKCQHFQQDDLWYLPVTAQLNAAFEIQLKHSLQLISRHSAA